ncbi:hypothetical protein MPSEU_000164200 [Mayamaea pseudoterrestris]|nr:hypothetical protein MPSEU_000164200 [Mayamaea pseudoterrestris]
MEGIIPFDKKALGSDVLTLDIGGEKTIKTLRSTLTYTKGSKLAEMFSGRWDDSLPRNEHGHFFIDHWPHLFVPLHDFLRDLSAMVPPEYSQVPPMTPKFDSPKDEHSFRRMVDAYGLTNVLYNYEIYQYPTKSLDWNRKTILSRERDIFGCPLTDNTGVSLDRPSHNGKDYHSRRVQAFEVVLDSTPTTTCQCMVGWIRKDPVYTIDENIFCAHTSRVYLYSSSTNTFLVYYDREGKLRSHPVTGEVANGSVLRCGKNEQSCELEWFLDGSLVAVANKALGYGVATVIEDVCHLGWSVPDEYEMIPYVHVHAGTCRFSALELDN